MSEETKSPSEVVAPDSTGAGVAVPTPPPPPPIDREELLRRVHVAGHNLRNIILEIKKYHSQQPHEKFEYFEDPARALSLAQSDLQTGFRWLYHSIYRNRSF